MPAARCHLMGDWQSSVPGRRWDRSKPAETYPQWRRAPMNGPGSNGRAQQPEIDWLGATAVRKHPERDRGKSATTCPWGLNLWERPLATAAGSSKRQARGLERRAGCNADRRCTRRLVPQAQSLTRVPLASPSTAFLAVIFGGLRLPLAGRLAWLLLVLRGLRHIHLLTLFKRIRWINDDAIRGRDASENFQRGAVIASYADGPQLDLIVRANHCNLRTLGAEQHRIHRHRDFVYVCSDCEMYLSER